MGIDNNVTIAGNVGSEPDLRFTGSGLAVAKFSVAVYGGKDKDSSWFDVTAWDKLAENCSESITKGSRVVVFGRLVQDKWEDKETGKTRTAVKVIADDVAISLKWDPATSQRPERTYPDKPKAAPAPKLPDPDEEPF